MLDNETKRRIDTARDILVGKVPDPKSQVEQITIALIYKFMDDMDAEAEELGGTRSFFAGEFEKYSWARLLAPGMGGFETLALYGEAIAKMPENPGIPLLFRDIFKNAYLPYRDPETLKSFLKVINDFTYDHSERLGDAFEYLLSVLGSQGDAGQFRTPRHIIDFMVALIAPQKNESILDPACGTAGFLISAYKYVLKNSQLKIKDEAPSFHPSSFILHPSSLTPDERTRLLHNIKGYDISPDMVRLSLVNMYLHGFSDPHIAEYDTLTSADKWHEYADIIMANPPFMSPKGGIRPHNRFSIHSSRSEVLFVDYIAEHLSPTGRAAVIVPEGVIFQSGTAYKALRKMLVENYLVGVISLPAGVFNPYSGVKTSILWLDKSLAKKTNQVVFIKIENDGYDLGAQRRPIKQNDLPAALENLLAYKCALQNGAAFKTSDYPNLLLVDKARLAKSGEYNLSGERYKAQVIQNLDYELVRLDEVFTEIRNGVNVNQIDEEGKYLVTRIQTIADGIVNLRSTKWTKDEVPPDRFMKYGDILLSHINSYEHLAKTAIFLEENQNKVIHGINLIRLRPNTNKLNSIYAIYILKSENFIQKAKSFAQKAVNQASIKTSDIKSIQVPLPPLDVQVEIAAEIEGYQKIIDGARQVLEAYRPRIEIDPAWPVVSLESILKVDATIIKDLTDYQDFYYIGGENIESGSGNLLELKTISERRIRGPVYKFKENQILYNKIRPYLNKATISTFDGCCSADMYPLSPVKEDNIHYLLLYLLTDSFLSSIKHFYFRARMPKINREQLYSVKIPLPDRATQDCIVAQIEREQALVKANRELIEIFEQKIKARIARVWGG